MLRISFRSNIAVPTALGAFLFEIESSKSWSRRKALSVLEIRLFLSVTCISKP